MMSKTKTIPAHLFDYPVTRIQSAISQNCH
jgi:hypothetical protein